MTTATTNAAGSTQFLPGFPAFVNELAGTLAVHSQYVLHGNIRDRYLVKVHEDGPWRPIQMRPVLWEALRRSGYECLLCYDPVDGVTAYPPGPEATATAERVLGKRVVGRRPTLERLRRHLAKVVGAREQPPLQIDVPRTGGGLAPRDAEPESRPDPVAPAARVAFVIDYAARITRTPGQLEAVERDFFLYCQKLAFTAEPVLVDGPRPSPLYNPVIWLVEGERDLPAWLTAGVEPIRTIAIGMPTLDEREDAVPVVSRHLALSAEQSEKFARAAEGMTLHAMTEIALLAKDRRIQDIGDAVRIYKLGVDDDPWRRSSVREHIRRGEVTIGGAVKGQQLAITKTLDILKRSALGLSGAQTTSKASRPRGVLFFAGPTGVGKTELAKQVAGILFGDTNAFLRFDMSEFAQDHAADRLIGAPPGYVGFEAGGELTGGVRRKPFQVVLFDEIEKAHPKVLDKFLQILEDGRLTDGQGLTTYFSGCVLIFTSNLGIIVEDPTTRERTQIVTRGMDYPVLEAKVKDAIRDHFTRAIGRPELLNRLGDNIVVFDFISKEVAGLIFDLQLRNVVRQVGAELGITLRLEDPATAALRDRCTRDEVLDNGGRGIGSEIESSLINPLARHLFDRDCRPGTTVEVRSISWRAAGAPVLDCVERQ